MLMDLAYSALNAWDGEYGEWENDGRDVADSIKECMNNVLEELGKGI
jgi:hypothetical protein